jgi:hypothetical protein
MTDLPDRFCSKFVVDESGCWLWIASIRKDGYARFQVDGEARLGHRFAYEFVNGPVPPGLELDHLCRVRRCVNPAHLEPVTRRVNVLRGESPAAVHARKTACPNGHPYDMTNTNGARKCRQCIRERRMERIE